MNIGLISHPDCLLHEMGESHPEQPARIQAIANAITESGLDNILKKYLAPLATREQLLRVHPADYVEHIFKIAPQKGLIALDPDTWMNPHTVTAALRAAGAAVFAVDLIMKNEIQAAFCNVRPPGHHAERARAMGFCFFNNIAVAVAHALEYHGLKRIAIVDFDVHHGNGTEDIFKHDERVLFCSSFQYPLYPFAGIDTVSDHIINVPLPPGALGSEFRKQVQTRMLEKLYQFQPEMIFVSAGFDAHAAEELASLNFHEGDYAWIGQQIKQLADETCQGRIVSTLEGGYVLDVLGRCVVAYLRSLTKI